ncbi:MAG TPA: hypothetical protein VHE99_06125 [Gammaproteobacteria bacterium]|nr:hypothetical protein [Gammaproteobacteria bacterium]
MSSLVIKQQKSSLTPTSDKKPTKVLLSCPTSIDEVEITFDNPSRDQPNITDYTWQILKELLLKSCVKHAVITSTIRTSQSQAEAMYNNLKSGKNVSYKVGGNEVTKIYHDMAKAGKSQQQILAAMTELADNIITNGGEVSTHVNEYNTLFYNVLDISLSKLIKGDTGKKFTIEEESQVYNIFHNDSRIRKVHDPSHAKDPALHLEIPQPLAFNNSGIAALEKQKPFKPSAKLAIERARGLPLHSLKYASYPYIFYTPTK